LIGSSTEHSSPLSRGFYNIARTREVPVIIRNDGRNEAKLMKWELVPSWAPDPSMGQRISTLGLKPSRKAVVQASVEKRRCLIPAKGFYKWRPEGKRKFRCGSSSRPLSRSPFLACGMLWGCWVDGPIKTIFAVVLVATNPVLFAEFIPEVFTCRTL